MKKKEDLESKFLISNPFFTLTIKLSEVLGILKMIKDKTAGKSLSHGIELLYFQNLTPAETEKLGLLVTFLRCNEDGNVHPPADMNHIYLKIDKFMGDNSNI